jgi:Subtilisin-like serine proteases
MGADVINMSFGSYGNSSWGEESILHDTIRDAYEAGVIMVAAAGNDGKCAILPTSTFYPAAYDEVIGVMAYIGSSVASQDGTMGAFNSGKSSNYGNCYDIVAPGKDIYSAMSSDCADGQLYGNKDGTSMASPFVSAMAAILLLKTGGNFEDVRDIIKYTDAPEVTRADAFGTNYSFKKASLKDMLLYYVPVLRVQIEKISGETTQTLGLTEIVNYKASLFNAENVLYPEANESYNRVHWKVTRATSGKDKVVAEGYGQYFSYTPSEVGEYKVSFTATQNDKISGTLTISVVYATQEEIPIVVTGGSMEYVNGGSYVFEINSLKYYDPNYAPRLNWYVNDKLVPVEGDSFKFEPTERGEYKIVCKVAGGEVIFSQTVKVGRSADEEKTLRLSIGLSVGGVVALGITVIGVVFAVKKRRAQKKEFAGVE